MFEQERNKKIVQRFYQEIWNEGKFEVADEIFALDFRGGISREPGDARPGGGQAVHRHVPERLPRFPHRDQ